MADDGFCLRGIPWDCRGNYVQRDRHIGQRRYSVGGIIAFDNDCSAAPIYFMHYKGESSIGLLH